MNELSIISNNIPSMSSKEISKVRELESLCSHIPQVDILTSHIIHGGLYARTIMIPAGSMITGALIKIATILIIQGDVIAYIGDKTINLCGYNILPAGANRKQAFIANMDTYLTMIFPTDARGIKEAEEEFTDEADMLISRANPMSNVINITGE